MNFHVGQLVVCVAPPVRLTAMRQQPKIGTVYTVRDNGWGEPDEPTIRLVELISEPRHYRQGWGEHAYVAARFRPVDEARLSIFRKLLAPLPQKGRVEA